MTEENKNIFLLAKQIHFELEVPNLELDKYLNYLKAKSGEKPKFVLCGGCLGTNLDVNPNFARAFSTFTDKEKAEFYLKTVKIARDILENKEDISGKD